MSLAPRIALRKISSQLSRSPCPTTQTASYYMKPKKTENSSKTKNKWALGSIAVASVVGLGLAGKNWSGLEDEYDDLPLHQQIPGRVKANAAELFGYMMEPRSQELLLPDMLPPPYQAPYTLLIELNDLLIHSSYTRTAGWRAKKRQGIDIFLESLCKHYEIVLFTKEHGMSSIEMIEAIDPKMCILYKLFRDSCRYKKGVYLKDLSNLNRDLSKVILIDSNRDAVACQPDNAIVLPKWHGQDDMDLVDLTDMLVVIAQDRPSDLRQVIKCYTELDDPIGAYRMRRQDIIDQENAAKLSAHQKSKSRRGILDKKWW